MNKFLLLATFLAMAASVSYAMPAEIMDDDDDDDGVTALLQELETFDTDINAATQGWRKAVRKVGRVIRTVGKVAKKVCSYAPVAKRVCGQAELQGSDVADEQVCKYVKVATKVCKVIG